MNLRVCDLFAGIGGASLAFGQAGFKSVFASEIDAAAADTYEANHRHRPVGDIASVSPEAVPDHDVCFIGLPCVGFSTLGRQRGFNDAREAVWYSALRLVTRKRPKVVVVENVAGFAENHGGAALRFVRGCLRAAWYRTTSALLDAAEFGGAQVRRRVFVVASRGQRFEFDRLERGTPTRIRDVLDRNGPGEYLNPADYRLLDRPHRCPSGPMFAGYRVGRLWHPSAPLDRPHTHQWQNQIYGADGPSPTLTARDCSSLLVLIDGRVRRLRGAALGGLQGFPSGFRWPHPGRIATQLGNSVHVPTVESLARGIKEHLF